LYKKKKLKFINKISISYQIYLNNNINNMSKLPTFGIATKNNLRLQVSPKIGTLKYSVKTKSPYSYSPKIESNSKSSQSRSVDNYEININDYVFIKTTSQKGIVRYVGETKFKTGIWVGVELDKRGAGKNNGTVMGVTYFKCPPATGLFIPITAVEKISKDQEIDDNTSEISTLKSKMLINMDLKSNNTKIGKNIKTPLYTNKVNNNSTDSISKLNRLRTLSSSSLQLSDAKPPKTPISSKFSSTSHLFSKSKIQTKSTSTSPPGVINKDIYSFPSKIKKETNEEERLNNKNISPAIKKINKKLIPLELKDSNIIKYEAIEEKNGLENGMDSGCEDDTIKVNEVYETNTNEEDDDIFSEKLSASSSTINGSPQEKKTGFHDVNKHAYKCYKAF